MSTTTIRERTIMTVFKTKKDEAYTPKGDWDWSNLSDKEIKERLDKRAKEAKKEYARGEYKTAEEFYKEWDEERKRCSATA